jgi:hypothetical protein
MPNLQCDANNEESETNTVKNSTWPFNSVVASSAVTTFTDLRLQQLNDSLPPPQYDFNYHQHLATNTSYATHDQLLPKPQLIESRTAVKKVLVNVEKDFGLSTSNSDVSLGFGPGLHPSLSGSNSEASFPYMNKYESVMQSGELL